MCMSQSADIHHYAAKDNHCVFVQLQYITVLCVFVIFISLFLFHLLFLICTSFHVGVALARFSQHAVSSMNWLEGNAPSVARVVVPSLVETVRP